MLGIVPGSKQPAPLAPGRSWGLPAEAVLEALQVDLAQGLARGLVHRRRQHYGSNRLRETKRRSAWRMLWDQLASPIISLLAAATGA
jgi:magnesium-transporting ATPase (P-type)